jgi:hypothetical protein
MNFPRRIRMSAMRSYAIDRRKGDWRHHAFILRHILSLRLNGSEWWLFRLGLSGFYIKLYLRWQSMRAIINTGMRNKPGSIPRGYRTTMRIRQMHCRLRATNYKCEELGRFNFHDQTETHLRLFDSMFSFAQMSHRQLSWNNFHVLYYVQKKNRFILLHRRRWELNNLIHITEMQRCTYTCKLVTIVSRFSGKRDNRK